MSRRRHTLADTPFADMGDAQRLFGVTRPIVMAMIEDGRLPGKQLAERTWRFLKSDIARCLGVSVETLWPPAPSPSQAIATEVAAVQKRFGVARPKAEPEATAAAPTGPEAAA